MPSRTRRSQRTFDEKMADTRVVNKRQEYDTLRIDRRTKWGNPFIFRPRINATSRADAIEKYEDYIRSSPWLMRSLPELLGHKLGCWCKPLPCHGDILIKLLKEKYGEPGRKHRILFRRADYLRKAHSTHH